MHPPALAYSRPHGASRYPNGPITRIASRTQRWPTLQAAERLAALLDLAHENDDDVNYAFGSAWQRSRTQCEELAPQEVAENRVLCQAYRVATL